jgi:hypothetical protein
VSYEHPDPTQLPPAPMTPSPSQSSTSQGTHPPARSRGVTLRVLAVLWLVAAGTGGGWLIASAPKDTVALRTSVPSLTAKSSHTLYGGDAYTGIQNAASDTEQSVVDGVNALGETAKALAVESAQRQQDLLSQIQIGLGMLIISAGLINVTVAFRAQS